MLTDDTIPAVILSRRQMDILEQLVTDGPTNGEIAKRLYLSEDTIKTHMAALLRKTGYDTRTQLIVAVLRDQLKIFRAAG